MSVDVSSLVAAIDTYAISALDCMGEQLAETARSNAPVDTGELASSIEWSGASGGGGNVTGTVTVGAPYGVYVEHGRGGEGGLIAIEVGGELLVVEGVGPAEAEPFFGPACDDWPSIVSGCA
jgi:Bacteriophage HK97-gp10, putative tail-component